MRKGSTIHRTTPSGTNPSHLSKQMTKTEVKGVVDDAYHLKMTRVIRTAGSLLFPANGNHPTKSKILVRNQDQLRLCDQPRLWYSHRNDDYDIQFHRTSNDVPIHDGDFAVLSIQAEKQCESQIIDHGPPLNRGHYTQCHYS